MNFRIKVIMKNRCNRQSYEVLKIVWNLTCNKFHVCVFLCFCVSVFLSVARIMSTACVFWFESWRNRDGFSLQFMEIGNHHHFSSVWVAFIYIILLLTKKDQSPDTVNEVCMINVMLISKFASQMPQLSC